MRKVKSSLESPEFADVFSTVWGSPTLAQDPKPAMNRRILRVDPFSGAAGDMFLGALCDLGISLDELQDGLAQLHLPGWKLKFEAVLRAGVSAKKARVLLDVLGGAEEGQHGGEHHLEDGIVRSPAEILDIVDRAPLPGPAKDLAHRAFVHLAEAEARVHGTSVDSVHFHEVGATDALIDICGTALGIHLLEIDAVYCAPVAVGQGRFHCAHGELPLPGPATLSLLEGFPLAPSGIQRELVTPTGAAILKALRPSFRPAPTHRHLRSGHGAGSDDRPERPNVLRLSLGEIQDPAGPCEVEEIAFEVDDMTPEALGAFRRRLPAEGVLDLSFFPCTMKKGRPGVAVRLLVEAGTADRLATEVFRHSSTFGLRISRPRRVILDREMIAVETPYGSCSVKIGIQGGETVAIHPEADEVERLAQEAGVDFAEVARAVVEAAARARG